MYQLLESIYLNNGVFRNLDYHEARMQASVLALFGQPFTFKIQNVLSQQPIPSQGLYKTRIIYNTAILKVEFVPYTIKTVRSIKLIKDNDVRYEHKLVDRTRLTELYSLRGTADDILIVKKGLITDTYYGNIIFKRNGFWYTPESYLLKGTMRQSLLDAGLIRETRITQSEYTQFESCKIINAMLGLESEEIPITSIC
jgi:4-amino-4-deoxychorismate lyase